MSPTLETEEQRRSRAFAEEVKTLVAQYFSQTGASPHGNAGLIFKSVIMAAAYFGSYGLITAIRMPAPCMFFLFVVMGLGLAGLGFVVAHDALHGAYSADPKVNATLGLTFEALGGNGYAWRTSHNGAHHAFPNVSGYDDDVDVTPLLRLSPHSARRPFHAYQHLFAFALYALATLNWAIVKDYMYFMRHRPTGDARRPPVRAWLRLVVGKLLFYAAMAMPLVFARTPPWQIAIGLLTAHLSAGLVTGTVFQLGHCVEATQHLPQSRIGEARESWAAHQLRSTSNFASGSRWLTWYLGGLNHQIEHHLFPRVCHVHYRAISPIVAAAVRRHGLPYNTIPSLHQAIGSHYRTLRRLGQPPDAGARSNRNSAGSCVIPFGRGRISRRSTDRSHQQHGCDMNRSANRQLAKYTALVGAMSLGLFPGFARAQTDEIQVYNAQIAPKGIFNITLHDNYTPDGQKIPAFPGAIVSNHSLNGVPEWAYGVADWMEAGLYFPLYSVTNTGKFELNGFKLRTLFVVPDAAKRTFFYGVNFEFSFNTRHWNPDTYTQEIRPILGWRVGKVDLIFNPILDNSWKGFSRLDFAPETRIDYNISSVWQVAAEEYDDLGEIRHFNSAAAQQHQLFGVIDYNGLPVSVEGGLGFGLTHASDHFTLKLILSKDLN